MPVETPQWRGTSDHNLSYSIIEIGDDWKFKVTLSSGTDTVLDSEMNMTQCLLAGLCTQDLSILSILFCFLCKQHWPNGWPNKAFNMRGCHLYKAIEHIQKAFLAAGNEKRTAREQSGKPMGRWWCFTNAKKGCHSSVTTSASFSNPAITVIHDTRNSYQSLVLQQTAVQFKILPGKTMGEGLKLFSQVRREKQEQQTEKENS